MVVLIDWYAASTGKEVVVLSGVYAAMVQSSTELRYAATRLLHFAVLLFRQSHRTHQVLPPLSAYAPATPCPVLVYSKTVHTTACPVLA
eukprot:638029-Rhodomonas_salina.5